MVGILDEKSDIKVKDLKKVEDPSVAKKSPVEVENEIRSKFGSDVHGLKHFKLPTSRDVPTSYLEHSKLLEDIHLNPDIQARKGIKTDTDSRAATVAKFRDGYPDIIKTEPTQAIRYAVSDKGELQRTAQDKTINGDIVSVTSLELRVGRAKISTVLDYTAHGADKIPCNTEVLKAVCQEIKELKKENLKNHGLRDLKFEVLSSLLDRIEQAKEAESKIKRELVELNKSEAKVAKLLLDKIDEEKMPLSARQVEKLLEEHIEIKGKIDSFNKCKTEIRNDFDSYLKASKEAINEQLVAAGWTTEQIKANEKFHNDLGKTVLSLDKSLHTIETEIKAMSEYKSADAVTQQADLNNILKLLQSAGMLHHAHIEGFTLEKNTTIAGAYQGIRFVDMKIKGVVSLDLKTQQELDPSGDLKRKPALVGCVIDKGAFYGNMGDLEISKSVKNPGRYALKCIGADLNGPGAGSDWSKMKNYNPNELKFENDYTGGRYGSANFDHVKGFTGMFNYQTIKYVLGVRQPCLAHKVNFGADSPMDLYIGAIAEKTFSERLKARFKLQALIFEPDFLSKKTQTSLAGLVKPVRLPNLNSGVMLKEFYKRDGSVLTCEVNKNIFYIEAAGSSNRGVYIGMTSDPSKIAIAIQDENYIVRQHYICDVDVVAKALEEMRVKDVSERVKRTRSQMNAALDAIVGASKSADDSASKNLFDIAFKNFFAS